MSFTEPLGAPGGGDSFSASHHAPDLPAPPSYDDDVVDEEKLDNYDSAESEDELDDGLDDDELDDIDTGESDDDLDVLDLDDELEIEDDDDGLVDDVDPEVSTDVDPRSGRGSMYE